MLVQFTLTVNLPFSPTISFVERSEHENVFAFSFSLGFSFLSVFSLFVVSSSSLSSFSFFVDSFLCSLFF